MKNLWLVPITVSCVFLALAVNTMITIDDVNIIREAFARWVGISLIAGIVYFFYFMITH